MESFTNAPTGHVSMSEGMLTGSDGLTNEQREYRDRHDPCVYCNKREGEWVGTVCPKCDGITFCKKCHKRWHKGGFRFVWKGVKWFLLDVVEAINLGKLEELVKKVKA